MTPMKIGFVGLGTMGLPLANNLRRAGHAITVWNRTAEKAEPLVRKGARLAPTPRAAASGQELVFTCVADEKALEAVLEGADGILAGLKDGDVFVDTSTAGTRAARSVEERVRSRGASFLAAPLLGSKGAAEQAQLVVVCGGPVAARDRARPALHAVSSRIIELDEPAQAALMKLVVNSLGGAMMAGFAEALALGVSGGLETSKVIETIQASSFHSPLYLMKGDQIAQRDFAPRFALALAEKDQRLAQEAAAEQGAKLSVNQTVRQLMADAIAGGRGELDLAAVADLVFERSGLKR
ncbi:NAD(P)-dependent oxidoreductase [Anaeromyxobacter paludicola]|uniref:3-hydroxyisobutyrate dehydrogenase n=1 Tax=Anaeromyxobacter paludicola TaxID=2918171 RepID=A0ABN6NAX2_9BACT|nr:NAD(P)-dependent oxidoreductase [Anaeromyxobacter paludicola]BDG09073.1 3-hydroxyisobutyrate dehydrogenase [Anaeromyxobacter paludicola]